MAYYWSVVPENTSAPISDLDAGFYHAVIESIQHESSKKGLKMARTIFRVTEPTQWAGTPVFERFVLGTEDDPDALDPLTWQNAKGGIKRFRDCFTKAQVPLIEDEDQQHMAAKGRPILLEMHKKVEPPTRADGTPNDYAGQIRSEIRRFYMIGERAVANGAPPVMAKTAVGVVTPKLASIAPTKAGGVATAVKAKKADTLSCPVCSEPVSRLGLQAHLSTQHPADPDGDE